MLRVAVTGARGNVGKLVVDLLANDNGREVVAVARQPQSENELRRNVRWVVANYSDFAALRKAFEGVETLALISSDGDAASVLMHHRNIIEAAVQTGVSNVVALSSLDADINSPFCYAKTNAFTERMLAESGLAVSIARSSISEFFLRWLQTARRSGEIRLPAADGRISLVGRDDVARTLASLTVNPQTGICYDVTGTRALDLPTIAEVASQIFRKPVHYIDITPREFVVEITKDGGDPWWVYAFSTMFESIREQRWSTVSDALTRLTGYAPTPFREIIEASGSCVR